MRGPKSAMYSIIVGSKVVTSEKIMLASAGFYTTLC